MIEFSGLSEAGPVREDNQDALVLPDGTCPPGAGRVGSPPEKIGNAQADHIEDGPPGHWIPAPGPDAHGALFALADGMGGYAHGDLASRLALQTLWNTYFDDKRGKTTSTLRRGVEAANLAVLAAAREMGVTRMGSTLTAGVIEGQSLHMAHIGDARAYLVRGGAAAQLTQDHSVVGDLLRMRVLRAEQVRTHARRSVLTRAVGLNLFPQPDVFSLTLQPGDWVVLCTDGVWSVVEDDEFARHACAAESAAALCRALLDLALARQTDDNVSALAVRVKALPEEKKNGKISKRWFF